MRILVMFDLPTASKKERKSYARFRKFLIGDGYTMEQFSVYTRVTLGRDSMDAHIERLRGNLPDAGYVTVLKLTDKQYSDRINMLGEPVDGKQQMKLGSQMTLVI